MRDTQVARAADSGDEGRKMLCLQAEETCRIAPNPAADKECVCSLSVRSKYAIRGTTEWQRAAGMGAAYCMLEGFFWNDRVNSALRFDNGEQWSRE